MTITIDTYVPSAKALSYVAEVGNGLGVKNVGWTSHVKPAAKFKAHTLVKHCTATVMTGAKFSELAVNDGRETGDLPFGKWAVYPHIIIHIVKGATEVTEYARMNVVPGTIRATYFVDGTMVTRETWNTYLTPSVANAEPPLGGTVTVKLQNLTIL